MTRASGILMSVSSLPSPWGIGTLGKAAYEFADFLTAAGQKYWQMLPLGPTSYGDSPYSSFSTFAGNPYFVDLDRLCEEGLLERSELEELYWGSDPSRVDYGAIYHSRWIALEKAYRRGWSRLEKEILAFEEKNKDWLEDYALFMALKRRYGMASWIDWPDEDVRLRKSEALIRCRAELQDDIRLFTFVQYQFFRQWEDLRSYVHSKGISIIGDIPIYVALDSADVWAEPGHFQLDERNIPTSVAGVPPDYFSADGQLWGNPLYDWDKMKKSGYNWWIRRFGGATRLYDVIRIDHFRGFESYWSVPYGETTARNGHWEKGPGMDLVGLLRDWFRDTPIIAEDLGFATDEVRQLLDDSGFPGMKVLEFAFDSREPSDYLPHNYPRNCVCYVGTHDNETLQQWFESAAPEDVAFAVEYLGLNEAEGMNWGILRGGMASVADLFVAQMQDYLGLGAESRMNTPGKADGNWCWRMLPGAATDELAQKLRRCVFRYVR
ncbi:MAG: 4-alpha-glucanotransferase [Ruminococcaceae bacterium]|nr:4-alpha-glucanotransferase [Oscillospiraceae bacterium]